MASVEWIQMIWICMWTWVFFHWLGPIVFQVMFVSQSDKHLRPDIYIFRNQHQCSSVIIGAADNQIPLPVITWIEAAALRSVYLYCVSAGARSR